MRTNRVLINQNTGTAYEWHADVRTGEDWLFCPEIDHKCSEFLANVTPFPIEYKYPDGSILVLDPGKFVTNYNHPTHIRYVSQKRFRKL